MTTRRQPRRKERRRRRRLNRGTEPLWWADPPITYLRQLYARAAREVSYPTQWTRHPEPIVRKQPYLRRVSERFHEILREERIYVEGAG